MLAKRLMLQSLFIGLVFQLLISCGVDKNPAAEGFDKEGSDKKAIELADLVMENMGGYQNWKASRYIAWSFYGQYQIWDKHNSYFRWERNGVVVILNLLKDEGMVFRNGEKVVEPLEVKSFLQQAFVHWASNVYFLALPYKLKDSGVTLKYVGEGKTWDDRPADKIAMTFKEVGITAENKHELWIDKEKGLVTQWAFYSERDDIHPVFARKWSDYKDYNGVMLASNRDSELDNLRIEDIVVTAKLPDELFFSKTPVDKNLVK